MLHRMNLQVRFITAIWLCPVCAKEDTEERNVDGGDSYEHTCSECGVKFNQSGPNLRKYEGAINYTPTDIDISEALKNEEAIKEVKDKISADKKKYVDEKHYDFKNPPPYEEQTVEILEKLKAEKQEEVDRLQQQIDSKKG